MKKFLSLSFLPASTDLALLLLRVAFGLTLLCQHGWGKLMGWSNMSTTFPDPLGMGSALSLGFAIGAEVVAAALLTLGLFTRLAALVLAFTMGVIFFLMEGASVAGGEKAVLFGMAFVALLVAGAGRYSLDAKFGNQ